MSGDIAMKIYGLTKAQNVALQMSTRMGGAIIHAVGQEAQLLRRFIVEGLRDQNPGGQRIRPLAPMTIAMRKLPRKSSMLGRFRRGSTKALINDGDLIGSVNAEMVTPNWWTVGVHRKARSKAGKSMADLALIHEKGTRAFTVTVTHKMHRFSIFLMMQGILNAPWPVGKKLNRKIPARPFLEPAHREWDEESNDRFQMRIAAEMGMALGKRNLQQLSKMTLGGGHSTG